MKHLLLGALLEEERPRRYVESHAGKSSYPFDDPEHKRAYDAHHFLRCAENVPALKDTAYWRALDADKESYPGSPALAIRVLAGGARYLFHELCESDLEEVGEYVRGRGLEVERKCEDGLRGVRDDTPERPGETLYFIDPCTVTDASLDAFRTLSENERVVLWYSKATPQRLRKLPDTDQPTHYIIDLAAKPQDGRPSQRWHRALRPRVRRVQPKGAWALHRARSGSGHGFQRPVAVASLEPLGGRD